jgi:hypothetical protein
MHFSVPKNPTFGPLKRVPGRISKLGSNSKGASYFEFDFSSTKKQKIVKKPSARVQRVLIYYFKPSKNYSSRDTFTLN